MKKLLLCFALILTCAFFTACGGPEEPSSSTNTADTVQNQHPAMTRDIDQAIKNNPQIKPGAEVSGFVDEDGTQRFSYTNPDGSGGGGAVFD